MRGTLHWKEFLGGVFEHVMGFVLHGFLVLFCFLPTGYVLTFA